VVIDLDATIVLAHSETEGATPTWKRTFGFHPLLAFLDHGPGGTGEPVAGLLRTGKATANNAADHITVLTDALTQLPDEHRARVLVRGDSGAGVHAFGTTSTPSACTIRSVSTPTSRYLTRWPRCPGRRGRQRWTPTAAPASARRSPS